MSWSAEDALELAARALGRRDFSRAALAEQLARSGVERETADRALDALVEAGYLDEARLAIGRARTLAERGCGDEAIAARLARVGVGAVEIEEALAELPPEDVRARQAITALTGGLPRRCAALRRRGFSEWAIESALAHLDDEAEPPLA
ncbi:MAG TPA: RecX family transcriptional regulator [Thermoleophilia bacterium]|nr:RecX family transcriptional regulator [Thermoleophilia bacterium]